MRQSRLSVSPVSDEHWKLLLKMSDTASDRQHPRHPRDVGGGRGLHLQRCADQARGRESVPSVQAIGVRGVFATLWCALALLVERRVAADRAGGQSAGACLRGVLEAGSAIVYLVALFHIPFAIATARSICRRRSVLTVLAVLILKEDVRWRRWSAVMRRLRGRAAGDPAASRRPQRLDLGRPGRAPSIGCSSATSSCASCRVGVPTAAWCPSRRR